MKVKITNLLDESVQGSIYAFSPKQKVLAVSLASNASLKNGTHGDLIRLINTAFIKSIQILPQNKKTYKITDPRRAPVDIAHLEAEINAAILAANDSLMPGSQPKSSGNTGVPKKNTKVSPLASKVYDRLSERLGKENVQLQNNESILLFKEVAVAKPYALNKISNSKKAQNSKHIDKARAALREVWMGSDKLKRGG